MFDLVGSFYNAYLLLLMDEFVMGNFLFPCYHFFLMALILPLQSPSAFYLWAPLLPESGLEEKPKGIPFLLPMIPSLKQGSIVG